MKIRIKICCISSEEEARTAINAGADALGLVGRMPSGPGPIEDELIARIAATVPPPVATFLLTSETRTADIIAHHRRVHTPVIQLVDALSAGSYQDLREALPGVKLVQVIHVGGPQSVAEALEVAPSVDALLLDSGNPAAAVKTLGGTGQVHDWSLSRQIVERSPVPVWLAGGLRPENVAAAVQQVKPFGLDVCSGLRTDGCLDADKLRHFIRNIRRT